jgi:hypothetical protein
VKPRSPNRRSVSRFAELAIVFRNLSSFLDEVALVRKTHPF